VAPDRLPEPLPPGFAGLAGCISDAAGLTGVRSDPSGRLELMQSGSVGYSPALSPALQSVLRNLELQHELIETLNAVRVAIYADPVWLGPASNQDPLPELPSGLAWQLDHLDREIVLRVVELAP
jgi:hypothetical protein